MLYSSGKVRLRRADFRNTAIPGNSTQTTLRLGVTRGEPASDLVGAPALPVTSASPPYSERLIAHGSDVDFADFQSLVEPATGLMLIRDPLPMKLQSIGSTFLPPTSPYFSSMLTNIMDDAASGRGIADRHSSERNGRSGWTRSGARGRLPVRLRLHADHRHGRSSTTSRPALRARCRIPCP